jgi:hypothetical protein
MQILINSDNQVDLTAGQVEQWQTEIASSLERFRDWITRVEVHLTDQNSQAKGGSDDIRCLMEARPASKQPVSIEVRSASVDRAIREATKTLERRLSGIVEKARTESRKR